MCKVNLGFWFVLAAAAWAAGYAVAASDQKADPIVVVGPGIWHLWFDQYPPEYVRQFLATQVCGIKESDWKDPAKAAEIANKFNITKVECVKLDSRGAPVMKNGKYETTTAYVMNFQLRGVHEDLVKQGIHPLVVLEPGPPVKEHVDATKGLKDTAIEPWLSGHGHNGGITGAQNNEPVIAAALTTAMDRGRLIDITGHSQFSPNLVSTLARYPELLDRMQGVHTALLNPAFSQPAAEFAAHLAPVQLIPPVAENLKSLSVQQLVRKDEDFSTTAANYKLGSAKDATKYLDFVESVAPEIGRRAAERHLTFSIISTRDGLTGYEEAQRMADRLGARFFNAKDILLGTQVPVPEGQPRPADQGTSWGNQGNLPRGSDTLRVPTPDSSRLGHSPNDSPAARRAMNDFLFKEIMTRWQPDAGAPSIKEGGVSMEMDVKPDSFKKDPTGKAEETGKDALKGRPGPDSLTWPVKPEAGGK